ncbi:MAG: hemerythrin domain-containing protein [Deltaproteobacteria bacterium]|nr:hemerythrin domain-containing protein [Deltaproteobacteria bacterium]
MLRRSATSRPRACAARGIDPQALLEEVHAEEVRWRADAVRWDERSLPELIDHILTRYHEPLITELPRILAMAHRNHSAGPRRQRPWIAELVARVIALKDDLLPHMQKEELVLFLSFVGPWHVGGWADHRDARRA